jgi:hypothetical protein
MADSTGRAGTAAASDQQTTRQIADEVTAARAADERGDPRDPVTGSINLHTFSAKIKDAEAATRTAIGAGFAFTPDQIQTQLSKCQSLSKDWYEALQLAQSAEQSIYAPAPDMPGSVSQMNQTRQSLINLVGVINSQIGFLSSWQAALSQAKDNYMKSEQLNEHQWQWLASG